MNKIKYGIDLGTVKSSIATIIGGVPKIIKTDTQKDTLPSCVYITRKRTIQVGDSAYSALQSNRLRAMRKFNESNSNAFIEFKRTMGTNKKYYSSVLDKYFTSAELTAEVLKKLKSFVQDENIKSIVITVPAKFTMNQKDATRRAAEMAGFQQCELLQEPIAASMAYGIDIEEKDGYWLVFDFGESTFSSSIIKSDEGIMKVVDTEGDNHLGGKNLDEEIVNEIIIPYLKDNYKIDSILNNDLKRSILQDAMKKYAEEAKKQMSFQDTYNILSDLGAIPGEDDEGNEIELDIDVDQKDMRQAMGPIFQKAIDLSIDLLERNNLSGDTIDDIILVGGPTHSPIVREMLTNQITEPNTSIDPMTVVSKGAALYASTRDITEEIKEQDRDRTKIQLDLGYESTSVEEEEFVTVKILKDKTDGEIPDQLFINIDREDGGWSSGKSEIGEKGDVLDVQLKENRPNTFKVNLYDSQGTQLDCEPDEFTIKQWIFFPSAVLPYHIGTEIKSKETGELVFQPIEGLEKNKSLPATGSIRALKTKKKIRPGNKDDKIKVPIYQGEYGAEGSRAIYNEHIYDVIITGDDLPKLLPEGSDVELTLKIDNSEKISFSAYFPFLDYTYDIEVPYDTKKPPKESWLNSEINKAKQQLNMIKKENRYNNTSELNSLTKRISKITDRFEEKRNDFDRKTETLNNLRKVLRRLDEIEEEIRWPKIEDELKDVYYHLEETNDEYGDGKSTNMVDQYKEQVSQVIKDKNVKVAKDLIENMRSLDFKLTDEGLGAKMEISLLHQMNKEFDTLGWEDKNKATRLLNKGIQIAISASDPESYRLKLQLKPIVNKLLKISGMEHEEVTTFISNYITENTQNLIDNMTVGTNLLDNIDDLINKLIYLLDDDRISTNIFKHYYDKLFDLRENIKTSNAMNKKYFIEYKQIDQKIREYI